MTSITEQVHGRFKVFVGQPDSKGRIDDLAGKVTAWVVSAKVAPKSIGVEYLESTKNVVLTVGYRDDEPPYQIKLSLVPMGKIAKLDPGSIAQLEKAMGEAASKIPNIICHELYVTADHGFHMVFMSHLQK